MKLHIPTHFFEQLKEAEIAGFSLHFHLLNSGSIYSLTNKKLYTFEEIFESILKESCPFCRTTLLYITTKDGLKGNAIEHWEFGE